MSLAGWLRLVSLAVLICSVVSDGSGDTFTVQSDDGGMVSVTPCTSHPLHPSATNDLGNRGLLLPHTSVSELYPDSCTTPIVSVDTGHTSVILEMSDLTSSMVDDLILYSSTSTLDDDVLVTTPQFSISQSFRSVGVATTSMTQPNVSPTYHSSSLTTAVTSTFLVSPTHLAFTTSSPDSMILSPVLATATPILATPTPVPSSPILITLTAATTRVRHTTSLLLPVSTPSVVTPTAGIPSSEGSVVSSSMLVSPGMLSSLPASHNTTLMSPDTNTVTSTHSNTMSNISPPTTSTISSSSSSSSSSSLSPFMSSPLVAPSGSSSSSSSLLLLPTPGPSHLVVATLVIPESAYEQLVNGSLSVLEAALGAAYRNALLLLGRQRMPTTSAVIVELLTRDGVTGNTPVVYYIVAGNQLVSARVVAAVMTNAQTREIGGYQVVSIAVRDVPPNIPVVVGAAGGVALVLLLIVISSVLVCMAFAWHHRRQHRLAITEHETSEHSDENLEAGILDHSTQPPGGAALITGVPHGHAVTKRQQLAPLLQRVSKRTGAWQTAGHEPLTHDIGGDDEIPATLFERVAHFSAHTSTPSHSKMRFHSSVAPSPSVSQTSKSHSSDQVKVSSSELEPTAIVVSEVTHKSSQDGDEELLQRRLATLERLKLQSQQRTGSRRKRKVHPSVPQKPPLSCIQVAHGGKQKETEIEAALGDIEASSHSDGSAVPVLQSRPATKRRFARRKLASRGQLASREHRGDTTDGYDVTDSNIPPSRQSRKYRSSRSQRGRPLSQQISLHAGAGPHRELAWMQTHSGMQLISIQPVERVAPTTAAIRPAWQQLPQLPADVHSPQHSRQQLDQLIQLHHELEKVEDGRALQHSTPDSTIVSSHARESPLLPPPPPPPAPSSHEAGPHIITVDSPHLIRESTGSHGYPPSSSHQVYYTTTVHPGQVPWPQQVPTITFHEPVHAPPTAGQLVWSPHTTHHQPMVSQPVDAIQLTQLRAPQDIGLFYPTTHQQSWRQTQL